MRKLTWDPLGPHEWQVWLEGQHRATVILTDRQVSPFWDHLAEVAGTRRVDLTLQAYADGTLPFWHPEA